MKAKPYNKLENGNLQPCDPQNATHIMMRLPGPVGTTILPVILRGKREGTNCWTWNGDTEKPTIKPSLLVNGTLRLTEEQIQKVLDEEPYDPIKFLCHTWINNGQAQFLADCTHELANQTVDLLDVDE